MKVDWEQACEGKKIHPIQRIERPSNRQMRLEGWITVQFSKG